MSTARPTRIIILGGGFGGVYTALTLDKRLRGRRDVEVTLINRDNFFLFTPMLHEVAASELDVTAIVNPIRKLLRRVQLFTGELAGIDLEKRTVTVWHGDEHHHHDLPFDHLVLGLGSVTNFYGLPGLHERSLTMKSLADAVALRNRVIGNLEEADFECCAQLRSKLMTFVVAGGGFAGVETAASIHDFARDSLRYYRNLSPDELRVVLVHSGEVVLPELSEKLGRYAQKKMEKRGMEIRLRAKVTELTTEHAHLSDGTQIRTCTLVWTAGTAAHPLLETLPCAKERGRIVVDEMLRAPEWPGVWAVGDCAHIPDSRTGRAHPPTAQHALREGKILAGNILAEIDGRPLKRFQFRMLGQLASLGRRTGVANILGVNFSGFIAWWLWRTIYLSKLPRIEKKCRVMLDWTLDLLFTKDLVQLKMERSNGSSVERLAHAPAHEAIEPSVTTSREILAAGASHAA